MAGFPERPCFHPVRKCPGLNSMAVYKRDVQNRSKPILSQTYGREIKENSETVDGGPCTCMPRVGVSEYEYAQLRRAAETRIHQATGYFYRFLIIRNDNCLYGIHLCILVRTKLCLVFILILFIVRIYQ